MTQRDESMVRAPVSDEKLERWAEVRADDAGHLARELVEYRRLAASPSARAVREALKGLIEAVKRDADEPGGRGISGYTSARLSDARAAIDAPADGVREALKELADLMDDVVAGAYKPDSFTTQPARIALASSEGDECACGKFNDGRSCPSPDGTPLCVFPSEATPAAGDATIPGSDNMDARFEWLQSKAIDMGYMLVPEPEHPDSPHAQSAPADDAAVAWPDDKLAAWARNWHWNDCAEDKPVDPSIYFRDQRMLKAFLAATPPAQGE